MKYLLDVNALLALGLLQHEFHQRVASWEDSLSGENVSLATCSITELGFVRVLAQTPHYGLSTIQARELLLRIKKRRALIFLEDGQDISNLPNWVNLPKQITDGHLAQLAKASNAVLATLDRRIPGSFLIPE
jgi:hypothetical protein